MPSLFDPFPLKSVEFKNRIAVSPMCQYSADDGVPNEWHLVHLGARAVGGAGLVVAEATAVSPEGRISLGDAGLWNDEQAESWSRIAAFVKRYAVPGIQIGHAAARPVRTGRGRAMTISLQVIRADGTRWRRRPSDSAVSCRRFRMR